MKREWIAAACLAALATSAWAASESERLIVYSKNITQQDLKLVLPAGAPSTKVKLACVAGAGRFSQCTVVAQEPAGREDVGQIAVKLAMAQKVVAKDWNGNPVAGRTFETEWELLAPGDRNPDWLKKPTLNELMSATPVKAIQDHKDGSARIACQITVEGYLDRCTVENETPEGYGFGAAALFLSKSFAMTPKIRGGVPVAGGEVRIPINWKGFTDTNLIATKDRLFADPKWTRTPTAAQVKAAYPPKATSDGQAVVRCKLKSDATTGACQIVSESPGGMGFGAAAKDLAKNFTARLSDEDLKNIKDYAVDIPFRFRNPTAPDNGRLTDVRWTKTLSEQGAALLYPAPALAAKVDRGGATVNCVATAEGKLADCHIVTENPAGMGFGAAVLRAAEIMQMNPWTKSGDAVEGRRLSLPFRLVMPAEAAPPPAKP